MTTLHGMIDDATSTPALCFRPHEDLHGYVTILDHTCRRYGVPLALYGDRLNVVRNDAHWTLAEQVQGHQDPTHFGRMLQALGIGFIRAHSPQAKGRIERLWDTLQDRLTADAALPGEGSFFIKSIEHTRSKATQAAYDSDLTRFIGVMVSNSVLSFTRDRLEAYFHLLASEGLSKATLHRKQAFLRMFARFCLTHGLWTADPTIAMASIPKPKRIPRPFSDDEINALMALDLTPREKVVRALLIYTGLRVSPLCSIKLGDISYAPPAIRVLVKGSKLQVVKMHGGLAELVKTYSVSPH